VEWTVSADGSNSYESERGLFIDHARRMHPDVCRFHTTRGYLCMRLHKLVS
jgi:hypothetical protein